MFNVLIHIIRYNAYNISICQDKLQLASNWLHGIGKIWTEVVQPAVYAFHPCIKSALGSIGKMCFTCLPLSHIQNLSTNRSGEQVVLHMQESMPDQFLLALFGLTLQLNYTIFCSAGLSLSHPQPRNHEMALIWQAPSQISTDAMRKAEANMFCKHLWQHTIPAPIPTHTTGGRVKKKYSSQFPCQQYLFCPLLDTISFMCLKF